MIETLLGQSLLLFGPLLLAYSLWHAHLGQFQSSLFILGGPGCILWCALRLRLPAGSWWRKLLSEGAVSAVLGLTLLSVLLVSALAFSSREDISLALLLDEARHSIPQLLLVLSAAFAGVLGLFLFLRMGVRLWLRWNQMRRTRLRWALTHAHLLVVVLGAGMLGMLVLGVDAFTSTSFPFYILRDSRHFARLTI